MVSVCLTSDALSQHLPAYLGFSCLGRGVSLHCCPSKAQPLLLTFSEGYLLTTTPPDLERAGCNGPRHITSWEVDGETVQTMSDFWGGSPKITADGDCSHEMKRHLLLGRKALTKLDSILKSSDLCQQRSSQRYGFSSSRVWM